MLRLKQPGYHAFASACPPGHAPAESKGPVFGPGRLGTATLLAVIAFACGDVDGPVLVTAEDAALPAELREAYREDAARLALREILQEDGPEADRVEISPERSAYFYSALVRVFNFPHRARDDVVDRYRIHSFPSPSVNTLSLRVGGAAWADAWRRGERLTGNPDVDRLVQDYGLRVYHHYSSPTLGDLFTLTSDLNLNARSLAKRFEEIEGVQSAYSDGACCDGNDIEAARTGIGVMLEFSVGYGDCPSGCIHRHFLSFRVWNDGRVEFAGERGSPAPGIALGSSPVRVSWPVGWPASLMPGSVRARAGHGIRWISDPGLRRSATERREGPGRRRPASRPELRRP